MSIGAVQVFRSLLIVDDDKAMLDTYRRNLQRGGALKVYVAPDSATALAIAETHRPDLCIVDFQLGTESGLALLEKLQALVPHMRTAMITGYGCMDLAVLAMRAGAVDVIAKPIGAHELLRRISRLGTQPPPVSAETHSTETPSLDRAMWEHMHRVLADCSGNRSEAARRLKIDRGTLQRWLERPAPAA